MVVLRYLESYLLRGYLLQRTTAVVSALTEEQRKTLGKAAKKKSWYKRIGLGECFGRIVLGNLDTLPPNSSLRKTVASLADWVLKNEEAGT